MPRCHRDACRCISCQSHRLALDERDELIRSRQTIYQIPKPYPCVRNGVIVPFDERHYEISI